MNVFIKPLLANNSEPFLEISIGDFIGLILEVMVLSQWKLSH